MKYTTLFLFMVLSFSFVKCKTLQKGRPSIKQGVYGQVTLLKGNVMPSPDAPKRNLGKGVLRTVYIYERTSLKQTVGEAPLFTAIQTKLVAKVKTTKEGYFQCKLLPGKYSIFTAEPDGKLFANLFEGDGSIAAFEVKANEVTNYAIKINYMAFY